MNNEFDASSILNGQKIARVRKLATTASLRGLTVFAGAGVSVAPPASCPTWNHLKQTIVGCFLEQLSGHRDRYIASFPLCFVDIPEITLRPEAFMSSLSLIVNRNFMTKLLAGLDYGRPNANHKLVALLAKHGILNSLITTNFETLFEKALIDSDVEFIPIRDEHEASKWLSNSDPRLPLFKPHGCLSSPTSLAFLLDDIQTLSEAKAALLYKLLENRSVLIMGYSGNDDDILPVLSSALGNASAYLLVYPLSSPNEPIQCSRIDFAEKIVWTPEHVLHELLSHGSSNISMIMDDTSVQSVGQWQNHVRQTILELSTLVVVLCLGELFLMQGDFRRANEFGRFGQFLAEDSGFEGHFAVANRIQSFSLKELSNTSQALCSDEARISSAKRSGDQPQIIDAMLDKMHVHLRNGDTHSAEAVLSDIAFLDSGEFAWIWEIPAYRCKLDWYTAILHRKKGEPEDAIRKFQNALQCASRQKYAWMEARIGLDLSAALIDAKRFDEALEEYEQVITKAVINTDWSTAAKAAKNRGALLGVSDRPELAATDLARAKEYFAKAADADGVARTERMVRFTKADFVQELFGLRNLLTRDS